MTSTRELGASAPVELIHDALRRARKRITNGGKSAQCPAHDDRTASLSITEGPAGKVLLHCHAGCSIDAIVAALGLSEKDLFQRREGATAVPDRIVATYDYCDESGALLFQKVRKAPKQFFLRRPDGRGGWIWKLDEVDPATRVVTHETRRVLFRLKELLAADPAQTVYVPEGEKDVLALVALGLVATTNLEGAAKPGRTSKWRAEYSQVLAGRHVVILPDNDEPGLAHAESIARSLSGIAASVRVLKLPELAPKGDVSDWLANGRTRDALSELARNAPEWTARVASSLDSLIEEATPSGPLGDPPATAADSPTGHATTPPASIEQFMPLDLAAYARDGIPPVPWILPGWIAEKDIVIVAGQGGIGKSTTIAALAVALATKREWCGLVPTRPVRVLYFDEEQGDTETARLFVRLGGHEEPDELKVFAGVGLHLKDPAALAKLEFQIREFAPAIVFLDSAQQIFGVSDENDATEVGEVFRTLFRLRDTYGCGFVLVHHKRKSGPMGDRSEAIELVRGSSAFVTQSSCVVLATAGPEANTLDLRQVKRRGATKQELRIAYEETPEGSIQLSGVEIVNAEQDRAADFILEFLGPRSEARRKDVLASAKAGGISERTVSRALKHLLEKRKVENPGRGLWRIARELIDSGHPAATALAFEAPTGGLPDDGDS